MKKLLRLMVLAGIVAVAVVVFTVASRKRAKGPRYIKPTPWNPPIVDEIPAEPVAHEEGVEEAIAAAEDEGMTPPPEEPAEDFALSAEGELVIAEFAAPGAEAELLEEEAYFEEELEIATEEGMLPPPDAPAEDLALDAEGHTILSELAAPHAADALAHLLPVDELETPVETDVMESAPDFGAMLEQVEAAGRMAQTTEPEAVELPAETEATPKEQDFLTQYFDKLAATPDEEPEVAVQSPAMDEATVPPPERAQLETPRATDDHLLSSVEEALGDLEPAPIVPPPRRSAESYLDEGNVYFNVGQYGLAIERYGQAIDLDRDLTAAFYNRANAHTRAGEFDKALADYDRALELQPVDADALNNRGMLHLYRANYPAALSDFNRALEIDPTDTTVMVNRGLAQLHGGNSAAALVDFREATQMDSGDAAAQYGAAQAAASMNNRDEALRYVARALELDPGYAREAAADPRLAMLAGDDEFMKLLRQSGTRSN